MNQRRHLCPRVRIIRFLILPETDAETTQDDRGACVLVCLYFIYDLLFRSCLYHCVWSVITAYDFIPEKRDNNYSPHPLTPTLCLRNNIQLITGTLPCCGCL